MTTVNAKKPYTIVGIPASSSNNGFNIFRAPFEAYSLKNTAQPKPIGIATNMAIAVTRIVPHISGNIPNLDLQKKVTIPFLSKKNAMVSFEKT